MKFSFDKARDLGLFGGKFSQLQVNSINAIMAEINKQGVSNEAQAAYILATAYHECYNPNHPETRLTPMVEFGGHEYLVQKKYFPYYGRGFSQLTWLENYKKEGERMGIDLITVPELMLSLPIAANSHVYCMIHGSYTGKKLSDYISDSKKDYVNARRIINGIDQADKITGYAQKFEECLK